jgi:S1-C subfamily serine protease
MTQAYVASGPVASWYYEMEGATIYGVPVERATWSIIDLPSSSADKDGTVGFGFLKNFNIIIDTDRRRVWLENFTGRVSDDDLGEPGFIAIWDPGRESMRVVLVTPGSPAAQAGVRVGDVLLGLDGKEMRRMEYRQVMSMLEGQVGTEVSASFSRNGELIRLSIPRQALVNRTEPRTN